MSLLRFRILSIRKAFFLQGVLLASYFSILIPAYPQVLTDNLSLEPDKVIEREIAPGKTDSFLFKVPSNQYVRILVEQQGIDLSLHLFGTDGRLIAEMNSPYGFKGLESVSLIAENSGDYTIRVQAGERLSRSGRYEIKMEPPRMPTQADRSRIDAERAFTQARNFESKKSWKEAIDKYQEARQKWAEIGDQYWEAVAIFSIGSTWLSLSNRPKAIEFYKQALSIQQSIGDRRGEAFSLRWLGLSQGQQGELVLGAETSKKALALWQSDGDQLNEAGTLNNLGVIYTYLNEPQEAINYHNRVLRIRKELGDKAGVVQTLNNIGILRLRTDDLYSALESFNHALSLISEIKNPTEDFRRNEGSILNNIGFIYYSLGEPDLSLNYLKQALVIRREVKDLSGEGSTLSNLGNAYFAVGDSKLASEYLTEAMKKQNSWGGAYTLINLGNVYLSSNDPQKALSYYNEALNSLSEIRDRQAQAAAHDKIGNVKLQMGDLENAESSFKQALSLWQSVGDRRGEATTLYGLARLEQARNNLAESLKLNEAAINIIENQRTKIINQQLRTSYFASVRDYYELEVDLLMKLGKQHGSEAFDQTALQISERSRARVLIETLNEARADICQGGNASLLEQRRRLEQTLTAKSERHMQLLRTRPDQKAMEALETELVTTITQLEGVEAQIRKESSCYDKLASPQTLDLKGIQQLLDPDTLMLQFFLGRERSFLWAITSDSMRSFELPGRAEIEKEVLALRELLLERSEINKGEREQEMFARFRNADAQIPKAASQLGNMLLSQVAPMLGSKRLVIVADGALHFLPFSLLQVRAYEDKAIKSPVPLPQKQTKLQDETITGQSSLTAGYRPLIIDHEIVTLPSASVLGVLRREREGRSPSPKAIAVLADPIFDSKDRRLKTVSIKAPQEDQTQSLTGELSKAKRDLGLTGVETTLPRLVFSRQEAEAISRIASNAQSWVSLDFDASRATITNPQLSQYRIIHFATHGLLNSKSPALSGIVLSLFDKNGQQQNGFIKLHEIYRFRLPAELVVLSACQTGLGKEVKGEGLVGLTRGFMHAGAARVVASLWKVDDEATYEFMALFYKEMIKGDKRPADALTSAQRKMMMQNRWKSPFYWAAFAIQGEWR